MSGSENFRTQSNENVDQLRGQSINTASSVTGGQAQQSQVPPHQQRSFSGILDCLYAYVTVGCVNAFLHGCDDISSIDQRMRVLS